MLNPKVIEKVDRLVSLVRFSLCRLANCGNIQSTARNYFGRGCYVLRPAGKFILEGMNIFAKGSDVEVSGQLTVGSRNYFNKNVKIVCFDKVEIGSDCLFADSVHIYDHDHRHDDLSKPISTQGYTTAPVKIGNNVWLGAKVTVLKGVTIGDGVIVGANSVVTRDIPANSICGGIPAKVIRPRQSN